MTRAEAILAVAALAAMALTGLVFAVRGWRFWRLPCGRINRDAARDAVFGVWAVCLACVLAIELEGTWGLTWVAFGGQP